MCDANKPSVDFYCVFISLSVQSLIMEFFLDMSSFMILPPLFNKSVSSDVLQSVQKCKQASSLKSDNNLKPIYSLLSPHNLCICFRNLIPDVPDVNGPLTLSGMNSAKHQF